MIIPEELGKELNAPRVAIPSLLLPDGTINTDRVVATRQFHMEMVEYLSSLLAEELAETNPLGITRRPKNWKFLLDGNVHKIDPVVWGVPDPVRLRGRIHASMQQFRNKDGVDYRANVKTVEHRDGSWHLEVQVTVREIAD